MAWELPGKITEKLTRPGIRNFSHLLELAAAKPGKVIEGFGELPAVVPFESPETTFLVKPDAPKPEQVQEVVDQRQRFERADRNNPQANPLMIAVLIHRMMIDERTYEKFDHPGQAADLMAGYSIHCLIQACEEILPGLSQMVAEVIPKKLEEIEQEKQKNIRETTGEMERDELEVEEWYPERKTLTGQAALEKRLEWIERNAQESREKAEKMDLSQKLDKVQNQWWEQSQAWKGTHAEEKTLEVETACAYRAEGFFKYEAVPLIDQTLKDLYANLNHFGYEIFKKNWAEWQKKGILTNDKRLSRALAKTLSEHTGLSEKTAKLLLPQILAIVNNHQDNPEQGWTQINNLTEELFLQGQMPSEVIIELIRNRQWEGYGEVDSIPKKWKADFHRFTAYNAKEMENYPEDFWNYMVGTGRIDLTLAEIKQIEEYYDQHHQPYQYDSHNLLFLRGEYEVDPHEQLPKSYLSVSPVMPSRLALAEVKQVKTGEAKKIAGFTNVKKISQKIIEGFEVDFDAWGKWVEATKRLGLSGSAKRNRINTLQHTVSVKKNGVKDAEGYGRYWSYNTDSEVRFPTQTELEFLMNDGADRFRSNNHHKCSTMEDWAATIVAARCDEEYGLDKYNLKPKQSRQMYRNFYQLLKAHNDYDISEGPMAAELRGSLIAGMGMSYDQWHIYGFDVVSDKLDVFDEVDLIMMLPDMAAENGNSPWFLVLGYKLLLQMDTDLRELYTPQLQASFDELIGQSVLLNRLAINPETEIKFPSPDIWVNMTPNPNRVRGWVETAIQMYREEPEIALRINLDNRAFPNLSELPWTDPDLKLNRQTGEISKRERAIIESVLPGMETARVRLPLEMGTVVETLAQKPETAGLEALTTAADLIRVMVGAEKLDKEIFNNPAKMIALLDQVIQVGGELRGAGREEIKAAAKRLEEPLSAENLSLKAYIMEAFLVGGFMEKEAVIEWVMRGVASGFMLSMKQGLLKIENMAKRQYGEAAEWGFMKDREELADLSEKVNDRSSYLKMRRKLLSSSATTMAQIGEMISYDFSATSWLQLLDQLGHPDQAARLRCYCVQQAYLLFDVIKELIFPIEQRGWAATPAVSLAIVDDEYGMDFAGFQKKAIKGLFLPDKGESFSHYHVLINLPTLSVADTEWYVMLDQTTQRARLFDQSAVTHDSEGNLIVRLNKTYLVSSEGRQRQSKEMGEYRVVVVPNVLGESIDPLTDLLDFGNVGDIYTRTLGAYHPLYQLKTILNDETKIEEKVNLLRKMLTEAPFYLFYDFGGGEESKANTVTELIGISNANELPVASLYLAHLLDLRLVFTPGGSLEFSGELIYNALTQCSLISDEAWENAKTTWQHLLLPNDIEVIERLRQQLKDESDEKKKQMMADSVKVIGTVIAGQVDKAKERSQAERKQRLESLLQFGDIPGFKLRTMAVQHDISSHAANVEARLQEDRQSASLGAGQITDDQTGLSLQIASVTVVKPELATMAAQWLLENVATDKILDELRLLQGTIRAFALDGRGKDVQFMGMFLNIANEILRKALKEKGIELDLPAGDVDSLRNLPKEEILLALMERFGKDIPVRGKQLDQGSDLLLLNPQ